MTYINDAPPPHPAHEHQPLFELGDLLTEEGVFKRLLEVCGSESERGLTLGALLHLHRCGNYGSVTSTDRIVNEYVINQIFRTAATGHVISLHQIGPLWLRLSTNLAASQTTIRLASPLGDS